MISDKDYFIRTDTAKRRKKIFFQKDRTQMITMGPERGLKESALYSISVES